MLPIQVEAYSKESFHCAHCKHDFQASVATWVDVSRTPRAKTLLQQWEFNIVTCHHCGKRQFAGSPFFYEDFAEGLLIAVFPGIPADHLSIEKQIRRKYGYYPVLEFFYDMTQLWLLLYLQEHYNNRGPGVASKIGRGEKRLRRFLLFVKQDPLMLTLRETLTATFLGKKSHDDLQNVLWRALAKIEGEAPWPRDTALRAGATT